MAKTNTPDADDFSIDFDVSTLDDNGKKLYESLNKQFRDAYLKKTSTLAEGRQGMEKELNDARAKMTDLERRYQEADAERMQFKQWWESEGQYLYSNPTQAAKAEGFETPDAIARELSELRTGFQRAQQAYDRNLQQLTERVGLFENGLRLQHDLFDLRFKHPEADVMRVLDTAKEKGINNLELAYNLAYGDEKLKAKEEELQKENETWRQQELEKMQAESKIVETTPKTTRYAPAENPKSYSEASNSLLNAIRGSGSGGALTD